MLKIDKQAQYYIKCEICDHDDVTFDIDGGYRSDDTPSRYFKRHGWREINGKTLCPKCAKLIKK
jgi:hypothetical protein